MRSIKFTTLITLIFLALFLFPRSVHAYVDPGTGSYVIQLIMAFFLGGVFAIKLYWKKIKSFLAKFLSRKGDTKDEE